MARVMDVALSLSEVPWEWGQSDCCTFACDVFAALYGIDPMAGLRGTYGSAAGAARLIQSRGGMEANIRRTLRDAGLAPCDPREGALGAVRDTGGLVLAGIYCGATGLWLVRTTTGLTSRRGGTEVHHVAA
jgi:hypothetical protein